MWVFFLEKDYDNYSTIKPFNYAFPDYLFFCIILFCIKIWQFDFEWKSTFGGKFSMKNNFVLVVFEKQFQWKTTFLFLDFVNIGGCFQWEKTLSWFPDEFFYSCSLKKVTSTLVKIFNVKRLKVFVFVNNQETLFWIWINIWLEFAKDHFSIPNYYF